MNFLKHQSFGGVDQKYLRFKLKRKKRFEDELKSSGFGIA